MLRKNLLANLCNFKTAILEMRGLTHYIKWNAEFLCINSYSTFEKRSVNNTFYTQWNNHSYILWINDSFHHVFHGLLNLQKAVVQKSLLNSILLFCSKLGNIFTKRTLADQLFKNCCIVHENRIISLLDITKCVPKKKSVK